jgi:hypothetical protein
MRGKPKGTVTLYPPGGNGPVYVDVDFGQHIVIPPDYDAEANVPYILTKPPERKLYILPTHIRAYVETGPLEYEHLSDSGARLPLLEAGQKVVLRLCNQHGIQSTVPAKWVFWEQRQRRYVTNLNPGEEREWTNFSTEMNGISVGASRFIPAHPSGIFQFKAKVSGGDDPEVDLYSGSAEIKMTRAKDDLLYDSPSNLRRKCDGGMPLAIGLCQPVMRLGNHYHFSLQHVMVARSFLGSLAFVRARRTGVWNQWGSVVPFANPTDKCNLFVAKTIIDAGGTVPNIKQPDYPYANLWAGENPDYDLPPWTFPFISTDLVYRINGTDFVVQGHHPEPGDIMARRAPRSGHVGVVDYDGEVISAGQWAVGKKDSDGNRSFLDGSARYRTSLR